MPTFFVDTSALAKLYHQEIGSDYLERLLQQPDARLTISRLSIVEMESVFAMKVRAGQLDLANLEVARRRLRADLAQSRLGVTRPVEEKHFRDARNLIIRFGAGEGLRTLDALQLSIALDLRRAGLIAVIIAADQRLCRVSQLAGCPAIDPQAPGPLVTS